MWANLSYLLKYVHKKRWFLLGYTALFLECLTPIIAIFMQRDLIDQVFVNHHYHEFSKLLALYAIFFFGPKLWFTVRKVTFFHISYHLQMSLSKIFLQKVYELQTENFNNEHVGKLLNNIRNDVADASDIAINQILSESVFVILSIVFLTGSITYISFTMLLVVSSVAAVYYFFLYKFDAKTKQYAQHIRTERANVSVAVEESISAVREIVAFNRQDWQMNRYEGKFQKYYKGILNEGFYKVKILFVSEPFLYGTKLIVILFGGMRAISYNLSLGEFVVSFTLIDQLVTAIGQLFQLSLTGKRLVAPVKCIQDVLYQEVNKFGTENLSEGIESIQFKSVTFRYSPDLDPVLNDLSIEFPIGKKIAFVGESGSGKTTIAQLLLRMYLPEKGEILINGVPIHLYGNQFTDKVSVVFQQPHFIPMTIRENLVFGGDYEYTYVERICKEMLCHDFIQSTPNRYETIVGERGTNLSGGQKQRLALTRAVLKNTDVLILDEATSALDTKTEYHVQQNIDRLRKGKTTIIIAHRLSTIQNADVIYVLENGNVVAQGIHDTLMSESPVYQGLYANQQVGEALEGCSK